MATSIITKIGTRLRREAGIAIERTFVYTRAASDPRVPHVTSDVEVQIERIEADRIDALGRAGWPDSDEWPQRIERGDACYGAWVGDELAHVSWVQLSGIHPITVAGVDVPIEAGDFWIYNCRTEARHRGRRIYPRTLQRLTDDLFGQGARQGWIYTAADNVASQRGIVRAGFLKLQTLRALRLGRHHRPLRDAA